MKLLWPTVAAFSTTIAIVASGTAIYTTWHFESVLSARSDAQLRQLTDRMNDALAAANNRSTIGDEYLDRRITAMKAKIDPLPGQVDAAVQDMRKQVNAAIANLKATLPVASPAPTASHDQAPAMARKRAG